MSFFGKNIRKIRSLKSLSQQEFGELFGLKRATLGAYEEERSEPKIETLINIANYFSIPIDDLLTKELTVNEISKFNHDISADSESIRQQTMCLIPFIDKDEVTNYTQKYNDTVYTSKLPTISLPLNPEKEFRGLEITGLEMSDNSEGFYPKDIIIGERVPKSAYKKLTSDSLVIVVTKSDLFFRRYYSTKSALLLRSYHSGVEDELIEWGDVRELWRVRYVFYRRLPKLVVTTVEEQINRLEEKIKNLENQTKK